MTKFLRWVLTFALTACGTAGDPIDVVTGKTNRKQEPILPETTLNCPSGTVLTYENFGEAFTLRHCTVCHSRALAGDDRVGAPDHINLDTAEDMAFFRNPILQTVTDGTMPPTTLISEAEKTLLSEWVNCGAPGTEESTTSFLR